MQKMPLDLGMGLASLGLEPMIIPGEIEGAHFFGRPLDFENHRILLPTVVAAQLELVVGTLAGQPAAQGAGQQLGGQQLEGSGSTSTLLCLLSLAADVPN